MSLPGWLRTALEYIGYDWPAADEDVLNQWAAEFRGMSTSAGTSHTQLLNAVKHVHGANEGPGIEAFFAQLNSSESNVDALENFKTACDLAATGCEVCSALVYTMKCAVIVQLGILAAALASGPGVLLVRQGVKWAIDAAINVAVDRILLGVSS